MSRRRASALAAVAALAAVVALLPAAGSAAPREVAAAPLTRAIASIRTFTCGGLAVGRGTGFLVGDSVVMTSRHVLTGACKVKVTVAGTTIAGKRWSSWNGPGVSEAAADLETVVLARAVPNGRVLSFGTTSAKVGGAVTTLGTPRGNAVVRAAGTVVWKGRKAGAPLLAARMRAPGAADGAPLLDATGRVLAVVQKARGSHDVPGAVTAGVVEALDVAAWWGKQASAILCDTYPNGGIAGGCDGIVTEPAPSAPGRSDPVSDPEVGVVPDDPGSNEPAPTDPAPATPRSPTDYVVKGCWVQYTGDTWDAVSASSAITTVSSADLLAKGPGKYWSIVQLTEGAPADIPGVVASLVSPTGFVSAGNPFTWDVDGEAAARPLDWQITSNGNWFFQSALYPKPQQWAIHWSFPNGQACDARFTVTG